MWCSKFKLIIIISVYVLTIFSISSCHEVSLDELKEEFVEIYNKKSNVFQYEQLFEVNNSKNIGDYYFEFKNYEDLYVYDGKSVTTLSDAYDNKLINEQQLSIIYTRHSLK